MVFATVPAAPQTEKKHRATSWPPPISANVPYVVASRLSASAFCRVLEAALSMGRLFSTDLTFRRCGLAARLDPGAPLAAEPADDVEEHGCQEDAEQGHPEHA